MHVNEYVRIKSESDPLSSTTAPATTTTPNFIVDPRTRDNGLRILAKNDLKSRQRTHSAALNCTMRLKFGVAFLSCQIELSSV